MSSENLTREHSGQFTWNSGLEGNRYVVASYYIETSLEPELVALAMAREQSACATTVPGTNQQVDGSWTARVQDIRFLGKTEPPMLQSYHLETDVYPTGCTSPANFLAAEVDIAFPIDIFGSDLTAMWHTIGGELHRLGFLNALSLTHLEFPADYLDRFRGPSFGIDGLREAWHLRDRPFFCRSCRPAVGLTPESMAKINSEVLRGGFDVVKDDELTFDNRLAPFSERVKKLAAEVRRVEDETGERKAYIVNLISASDTVIEKAKIAVGAGADALMVSPFQQGMGLMKQLAETTGLPLLWHNSWDDMLFRHPRFGISYEVYQTLQRLAGADMIIMPGAFATGFMSTEEEQHCLSGCLNEMGLIRKPLPIIAGGKRPERLGEYLQIFGSPNFMMIVATAVDEHPGGLSEGAKEFRLAWESLAN